MNAGSERTAGPTLTRVKRLPATAAHCLAVAVLPVVAAQLSATAAGAITPVSASFYAPLGPARVADTRPTQPTIDGQCPTGQLTVDRPARIQQ